jgi:hypothetical protein
MRSRGTTCIDGPFSRFRSTITSVIGPSRPFFEAFGLLEERDQSVVHRVQSLESRDQSVLYGVSNVMHRVQSLECRERSRDDWASDLVHRDLAREGRAICTQAALATRTQPPGRAEREKIDIAYVDFLI